MLSWVSVNANDGSITADLPTLQVDGALKQTLMRYETQTAHLPMGSDDTDAPPPNWETATREGAVFLVALSEALDNEPRGLPLWGGLVNRHERTVGDGVALSLATAEAYLDRVYVGDHTFTNVPQNTIVETLVETYVQTGVKRGLPIRVQLVGSAGTARTREYKDSEDKTLYSVLTEFSGVIGGPEWTIGWEWVDERKLGLVFYVGDRIGAVAPAGLNPAAQFYLPGPVQSATLTKGYGSDEGANDIMAVSSGLDGARPQSPHQTNNTDLRPRFEHRYTPSTSIKEVSTLTGHAQRALAAMKDGSLALTLTANREEAQQLGTDWNIGDDVGFDITAPEFPNGLTGTARCVGWELTETTVTPLIDVTDIEGVN